MNDKRPHGLSLCMLAHQMNVVPFGDDGLVKFLEHCSPNVEEINLVDTSRDGSLEAKLAGKIADNVRIFRTPYDVSADAFNFSNHRNYSLSLARYSWILVLDPDERIEDWKAIRDTINKPEENERFYDFSLIGCCKIFSDNQKEVIKIHDAATGTERLFRNDSRFRFEGHVLEYLHFHHGLRLPTGRDVLFCKYVHNITMNRSEESGRWYLSRQDEA